MTHIEQMIQDMCPNGVEWKTLGEVCEIETGKLNANAAEENGHYPFFTTSKEISYINEYKWDTEALLIAGNANIGDVKHYIGKFNAYQRTYVLTNFQEGLIVRFLYHYTKARLKDFLDDKKNEAAMSYIVLSSLQAFPIPLPPLEIQKKIVECLDKFSALAAELQAELQA
ncbi:MAG: restriction endonuclease subunit S, partial [Paludibacteraceae bacterium]|nr:restriction endonuclease subunit S [Paludibacteraceae bacterium]